MVAVVEIGAARLRLMPEECGGLYEHRFSLDAKWLLDDNSDA